MNPKEFNSARAFQKTWLILCILSFWWTLTARAYPTVPAPLDPQTYHSFSGLYSCDVDPSEIYGRGPATYRVERNKTPVWSAKLPFTLRHAQITDDGYVGGYAYTHGTHGWAMDDQPKGYGDLLLIILGPDGKIILNHAIPRFESHIHDNIPQPVVRNLVVAGPSGYLRADLSVDSYHTTSVHLHHLATGKSVENPGALGEALFPPIRMEAIRGTTLCLVHNWHSSGRGSGARFQLLTADLQPVWSVLWHDDYDRLFGPQKQDQAIRERIRTYSAILDVSQSNRFSLYSAAKGEKVTFAINPLATQAGRWQVNEISRIPFPEFVPASTSLTTNSFPEKPLLHLGTFNLRAANPQSLGEIAASAVDQNGRIYVADERTGAVHIYNTNGIRQQPVYRPLKEDVSGRLTDAVLGVNGEGTVYLKADRGDGLIKFSANGSRLDRINLGLDPISERIFPSPHTNQTVVTGYQKVFLIDHHEKPIRTIERRPDRKWMADINGTSIASDGSFAIGTGFRKQWHAQLFDANGSPVRTVEMPEGISAHRFAYTGKYLVGLGAEEIFVTTAEGKPVLRFRPLTSTGKPLDSYATDFLTTFNGRELWILERATKTVHRYQLPE